MKVTKRQILYALLFLSVILNSIMVQYVIGMNYFDELAALFSFTYIIFHWRKGMQKRYFNVVMVVAVIIVIGLTGNLIWSYQEGGLVVIKDIVAFSKMPVTMVALSMWSDKKSNDSALEAAYTLSKIILTIMFVFAIISLFVDIGMSHDVRRGISSFRFLFNHPTFLVYAVVVMSVVMVAHGIQRKDIKYHIEAIALLILSMRDKAFLYLVAYVFLLILIPNIKRIKIRYIIIVGIAGLVVSYSKIMAYLSYSWSPRAGMYLTGFQLLRKCFPIGSGFGTFASPLSGEYYSKVYYMYGFSRIPGVSPNNYENLGDAGWPYYYGQFGVIGCLLFAFILFSLYKIIVRKYLVLEWKRKAAYLMLAYLFIASLVESIFINEAGVTSMIVIFVFLGQEAFIKSDQKGQIENGQKL